MVICKSACWKAAVSKRWNCQEISSEVKGGSGTKILKIVEEGYQVTDEDVKNGKVLVELDSADLKDKITQEDIQFQTTEAALIEATQAYEIQLDQNETDIKAAEQKAKFAFMDLEKFMSDQATKEIVAQLDLRLRQTKARTPRMPTRNWPPKILIRRRRCYFTKNNKL